MTTNSVYSVTWLKFQSNTDRAFNFPSNILFLSMKNLSFVCIGKVAKLLVFRYCVVVEVVGCTSTTFQHLIFHRYFFQRLCYNNDEAEMEGSSFLIF